jgi:hypothetical protein
VHELAVDVSVLSELHHCDAAPAPGKQNYAAPAPALFPCLILCQILKFIHFDAAPAL